MKRALKWIGLAIATLALAVLAAWYSAFGHNSAIVDAQKLVPGVEAVKDGFVSATLLDLDTDKIALVDAGNDPEGKALLAALARRKLGPEAVAAIFLTHGHGDHLAGCKLFPAAKVYALAADVVLAGPKCPVTNPLADGEIVELGDLRLEAFAVPGHTPGSAVYLARGVLFFGDSAGASKDGTILKAVRLFSNDSAQNVASLKSLATRLAPRSREIKQLSFAHTGPLEGFAPLTQFAGTH